MNADLINMINSIDELCSKIEKETAEIKKEVSQKERDLVNGFYKDLIEYKNVIRKAGMKEFSYLTGFWGHTYGLPVYLVIGPNFNGFFEPGRIKRWAISYLPQKDIIKWWYEDLDKEAFDKAFQEDVTKAIKERVDKAIKENEEIKR